MDWNQFDRGVFLVNVLGIIYDKKTKKILIGRREKDPYLKELSWCFPGGRPGYKEDIEFYLKHTIKLKTGLDVDVKDIVFAKTYPEKREFLSIYYSCEVTSGKEKAGEQFVELLWVSAKDVQKHFTTSLHPQVKEYIKNLI